jgi:hypothetical protein
MVQISAISLVALARTIPLPSLRLPVEAIGKTVEPSFDAREREGNAACGSLPRQALYQNLFSDVAVVKL